MALRSGLTQVVRVQLSHDWTELVELGPGISMRLWLQGEHHAKRLRRDEYDNKAGISRRFRLMGELQLSDPAGTPDLVVVAPVIGWGSCSVDTEGSMEIDEIEPADTQIPVEFPNTYTSFSDFASLTIVLTVTEHVAGSHFEH